MHGRTRRTVAVLAVAAIASGALAASAPASLVITPNGPGEGESGFTVSRGAIRPNPNNGAITAPSTFKCNQSNLIVKTSSIRIVNGRINFVGQAYADKFRVPSVLGTLTWKGTLTSGTIRFTTKKSLVIGGRPPKERVVNRPCDTGTLRYATRR